MNVRKRPAAAGAMTTVSNPDGLAPYARFLVWRHAAGAGCRALQTALLEEHQVQCSFQTVRTWLETRSGETWEDYVKRRFTLASSRPIPAGSPCPVVTVPLLQWICYCSWRFCPDCGRMRTDGRLTSLSAPKLHDVSIRCNQKPNDRSRCARRLLDSVRLLDIRLPDIVRRLDIVRLIVYRHHQTNRHYQPTRHHQTIRHPQTTRHHHTSRHCQTTRHQTIIHYQITRHHRTARHHQTTRHYRLLQSYQFLISTSSSFPPVPQFQRHPHT